MNIHLNLTVISLAAVLCIASLTACSQQPSSAEIAAQVQVAMEQAEKDRQAALSAQRFVSPLEEPVQKPARQHAAVKPKPVQREHVSVPPPVEIAKPLCGNCGVVMAVKVIEVEGQGSGAGVVAGGVIGGLVGNQIGQGTGHDLATFAGVLGGAIAGNKIEKQNRKTKNYDITVQMEDGSERTLRQATDPDMVKGQKVKIENDVALKN